MGNPIVGHSIKFGLGDYGTKVGFSETIQADRIRITSENITFENFKFVSGTYIAPSQLISVDNSDITIILSDENRLKFGLDGLPGKTKTMTKVSTGGRSPPKPSGVENSGVPLSERGSLEELKIADNGWYFSDEDNLIYVKTSATTTSVEILWIGPPAIVDITLSGVPIDFGTVAPGSDNNPALDNTKGFPMKITVESTTTVNVDIYIKGTNWVYNSYTLGVENCWIDSDNDPAGGQTLKSAYPGTPNSGFFENVTPGSERYIYFWISVPAGHWAGTYTNSIYVKAVKDGLVP